MVIENGVEKEDGELNIFFTSLKNISSNMKPEFFKRTAESSKYINKEEEEILNKLYCTPDYRNDVVYFGLIFNENMEVEPRELNYVKAEFTKIETPKEIKNKYDDSIGVIEPPENIYKVTIPTPKKLLENLKQPKVETRVIENFSETETIDGKKSLNIKYSNGLHCTEDIKETCNRLQKNIETINWVKNKSKKYNDNVPRRFLEKPEEEGTLYIERINGKKVCYEELWRDIFNLSYSDLRVTKIRLMNPEIVRWVEYQDYIPLKIINKNKEDQQCSVLGKIYPQDKVHQVEDEYYGVKKPVCENCLENFPDSTGVANEKIQSILQ